MNTIEEFSSITGASAAEAENWLEMAGFVLTDAVELFFSSGGQGDQPTDSSSDRKSDKRDLDQTYARYDEEDEVRLPDQVKRQKLVDTDAYLATQNTKKITSAFSSGKRSTNDKEKTLSELFQAPLDIMTQTGFEEAKEIAKSDDKWLLVNIQKDSEFQSHALNRDFWSDEGVKDMVWCSFVFWQKMDITPEGETYIAYYKVLTFPHLAIIDPRTGAMKWQHKFDGSSFDKKKLAEKIQDFLGDNPTPSESRSRPGARPGFNGSRSTGASATSASSSCTNGTSSSSSGAAEVDAAEDPELAAAIALSLQHDHDHEQELEAQPKKPAPRQKLTIEHKKPFNKRDHPSSEPGFSVQEATDDITMANIAAASATATPSAATWAPEVTIRAQFRLPNGTKGMEKFSTTEDVRNVVRAAAKLVPAAESDKRFEIGFNFPRMNLSEVLKKERQLRLQEIRQQQPLGRHSENALLITLADVGVSADTVFFVTYLQ